ncbi:MAG: hypothetical protein ACKOXP_06990 [Flavobacteriales bacterium]
MLLKVQLVHIVNEAKDMTYFKKQSIDLIFESKHFKGQSLCVQLDHSRLHPCSFRLGDTHTMEWTKCKQVSSNQDINTAVKLSIRKGKHLQQVHGFLHKRISYRLQSIQLLTQLKNEQP